MRIDREVREKVLALPPEARLTRVYAHAVPGGRVAAVCDFSTGHILRFEMSLQGTIFDEDAKLEVEAGIASLIALAQTARPAGVKH